MQRILIALAAVVMLLAGCGSDPENTDPRKGRVVTDRTDCFFNDCRVYSWKVCVGPDLLTVIDAYSDTPTKRWTLKSDECRVKR